MLRFPDDTKVRVTGLREILSDLYSQGRPASEATAEEIIAELEARKNYIPASELVRREFAYILLKEYREYVRDRAAGANCTGNEDGRG